MKYIELSIKELETCSNKFARKIGTTYKPDCVVFVAEGGFIIGESIAKFFGVPLYYIEAKRLGNNTKKHLKIFINMLPKFLKVWLRKLELSSGLHKKNVNMELEWKEPNKFDYKQVLVVDDSIDTGNTAKQVMDFLVQKYPNKKFKLATLNVFTESNKVISSDFHYFENYIMNLPGSLDSKDTVAFESMYSMYINQSQQK